jgi:hypothetical protein
VRSSNKVLPAGVMLRLTARSLTIDPPGGLVSDDGELIQLADGAVLARGSQAVQLRSAVQLLASAGQFLPEVDADWARRRRDEIERAVSDCMEAASMWDEVEANAGESLGPSHLDLSRRLLARTALAKGMPPDFRGAPEAAEGRSRAPA